MTSVIPPDAAVADLRIPNVAPPSSGSSNPAPRPLEPPAFLVVVSVLLVRLIRR